MSKAFKWEEWDMKKIPGVYTLSQSKVFRRKTIFERFLQKIKGFLNGR